MTLDLSEFFEHFHANISLGQKQIDRIDSAVSAISEFLRDKLDISENAVFVQGSYANHTAIVPVEGGEYDVDIVSVHLDGVPTCDEALDQLEELFRSSGKYGFRVKRKKPCVRLEYATDAVGSFHVDVVPARREKSTFPELEVPRRSEGWKETAPLEYVAWCKEQGPLFMTTVKAMKRWRDEQQPVALAIRSIVLQVLTSQCMPRIEEPSARLAQTIINLFQLLNGYAQAPIVQNPVLPSENLAKNWDDESFRSFMTELQYAVEVVTNVNNSTEIVEAVDAWRGLLGADFPLVEPKDLSLQVSDYSHAQNPARKGWRVNLDPRYSVTITATDQVGSTGRNRQHLQNNGQLVFHGHKIHFKAHVSGPTNVEVWWQVANTGAHARRESALRGEIFKGRDLNQRPIVQNENWESTKYTGAHLTRVLLVRDSTVVAISDWFQVNIYAKGYRYQP